MEQEEFTQLPYVITERGDLMLGAYDMMFVSEQPIITKGIELLKELIDYNSVIEVGFGLGYTATKFQELGVGRHIILEPHPEIYQKALEWKENYPDSDIVIYNEFLHEWSTPERADLFYFDMNDLVFQTPDVITMDSEDIEEFRHLAIKVMASYAREICELPEFINKIDYEIGDVNYIQPHIIIGEE